MIPATSDVNIFAALVAHESRGVASVILRDTDKAGAAVPSCNCDSELPAAARLSCLDTLYALSYDTHRRTNVSRLTFHTAVRLLPY